MLQRYGNLLVYPNFIYIYFKIHVELHLKSEFLEINEHKVSEKHLRWIPAAYSLSLMPDLKI